MRLPEFALRSTRTFMRLRTSTGNLTIGFDLLERMLFDNLNQDRNRLAVLETKVKELSGV